MTKMLKTIAVDLALFAVTAGASVSAIAGPHGRQVVVRAPYLYRARNLVERFFNKIKQCPRTVLGTTSEAL